MSDKIKKILISLGIFGLVALVFVLVQFISNKTKLPTCDDDYATSRVESIVYENNPYVKDLMAHGFDVKLTSTTIEPLSYDKELHKYECRMRLELTTPIGVPTQYNRGDGKGRNFYERAVANVEYSIFKRNGETVVNATYDKSYGNFFKHENYLRYSD